jgi:hypothetical protein
LITVTRFRFVIAASIFENIGAQAEVPGKASLVGRASACLILIFAGATEGKRRQS